jgi:hypothetical protein
MEINSDFPFPLHLRKDLVANGRVSLHHIFPTVVGGVSYWIKGVDDYNRQVIVDCLDYKAIGLNQ